MARMDRLLVLSMLLVLLSSSFASPVHETMSAEELEMELKKIQEEVEKLRVEHAEVFTKGDLNKDNQLSSEEFVAIQKEDDPGMTDAEYLETFADHDTDGSGFLSLEEWQTPFEESVNQMLKTSDEEGMDEEERIARHRQDFENFDVNKDGTLDVSELEELAKQVVEDAAQPEHSKITGAEILAALDIDADGKISLEEYLLDGSGGYDDEMYGDEDDMGGLSADDLSIEEITGGDLKDLDNTK